MTTYRKSNGDKITKSEIDRKIRFAKSEKFDDMMLEHGYFFCEECGRSGVRLDMSHDISVNDCQRNGMSEKAFEVSNLTMLCRKCHQKKDGLDLRF